MKVYDLEIETNTDDETITKLPFDIRQNQNSILSRYRKFWRKNKNKIKPADELCKSSTDLLKLNTISPNADRAFIKYLKESKAEIFTYQLNENKPYRIVIKNLHLIAQLDFS